MKKLSILLPFFLPSIALAAQGTYELLAPLGPLSGSVTMSEYLSGIMQVVIGVAGIAAVVRIVWCGIQLMGTPSVSQRSASKECITNAILGLLLALGSWVILNTINTDLVKKTVTIAPIGESSTGVTTATDKIPTAPGWYYKYLVISTNEKHYQRSDTGGMCERLRMNAQADYSHVNVLTSCFEVRAGEDPTINTSKPPPPQGGGISCNQAGLNLCEPQYQLCGNSSCTGALGTYANSAASKFGGSVSAGLVKAIIFNESSCGKNVIGDSGRSCGPMQTQMTTVNKYRDKCGIKDPVTCGWLADKANWEGAICLGAAYLDAVSKSSCGSEVRNIAAGYNGGIGVCGASTSCTEKNCAGGTTQKWECLYDDSAHKQCNTGYTSTRNYATHAVYCASHPAY
jgi:type IV secretory pathway VirB2 component (pilin)